VTTRPFNYEVTRRYSDFQWLRTMLIRDFPGFYIPPMADKGKFRSFEMDYLKNRMGYLQEFIDCLAQHTELRTSQIFIDFLKINDSEQFNKAKTKHQNTKLKIHVILWVSNIRDWWIIYQKSFSLALTKLQHKTSQISLEK